MARHTRRGNKSFLIVFIAVVIWVVFNGLFKSNTAPPPQSSTTLDTWHPSQKDNKKPWPFLEDNKDQQIAENLLASNIYIVFDGSGSMGSRGCSGNDAKIRVAKRAVDAFADALPRDTNIGITAFDNSGTRERLALGNNSVDQIKSTIDQISYGGNTPLSEAMNLGYKALTLQARKQLGYGEYHLLVVTDGQANNANNLTQEVDSILSESPVLIHTIGFCIDENHSLHQPGKTNYSTARDYEGLLQGMKSVLAEAPAFTVSDFKQE